MHFYVLFDNKVLFSNLDCCLFQLLVTRGAPLFKENGQKQTPCDCAEKNSHGNIALYLESKMVFSVS